VKILVTGGAGFIGSHVVDGYLTASHQVAVVDNLSTGKKSNLSPAAAFYELDVASPKLEGVFAAERPDLVSHHAAQASVKVSTDDPVFDAQQNVMGLLNVLGACVKYGVKKIIFASSGGAIYGEPLRLPVKENHALRPRSPYAIAKMAGVHYLRYFAQDYSLEHTVLRYANIYGPRQDPFGEAGVVAIFSRILLDGGTPEIHWDGEQRKDYLFVGDAVRANLLALTKGGNRVYNIGTGQGTSVNELFQALSRIIGTSVEPRFGPKRPGDLRLSYLDCTRARRELGWEPRVALEEGLERTVDYFRNVDS
jgi:UDP-glucose 4-epimerase